MKRTGFFKRAMSRIAPALVAALIFTAADSRAFLGFGGERSKKLKEADTAYAAGVTAYDEKRYVDAYSLFDEARAVYAELRRDNPSYNKEHVAGHFNASGSYMQLIQLEVRSGNVKIPMPGEEKPVAENVALVNVAVEKPAPTTSTVAVPSVPTVPTTTTIPIIPIKPPAPPAPLTPPPAPPIPPAESNTVLNDAARVLFIDGLIANNSASDAVLAAEDFIDNDGGAEFSSDTTRLLLVRALMEAHNYERAGIELSEITAGRKTLTPAMRSYTAALAFQRGDFMGALLQMNRLIDDHPDYADARVNIAYCYHLMDPAGNAEITTLSYRAGIAAGAKRDTVFERAAGIKIEN